MAKGTGRAKYKRVPDLYVRGTTVELDGEDGEKVPLWLAVLNPFERQEARKDGQTARARMVLAMKEEGTPEMIQAEAAFSLETDESAVSELVDLHGGEIMVKVLDGIKDDPEWKEKLEITERQEEILAKPPEDAEVKLLTRINEEYLHEVNRRLQDERDYLFEYYRDLGHDDLRAAWRDKYIESRGNESAQAEYQLTELWYAARVCEREWDEARADWTHRGCAGHREQVWETKAEVRALPDALYDLLTTELSNLNMSVREAKNSGRQRTSSGSSPLPSEGEESMPSTPSETPDSALGISLPPSTMPSPS